MSQIDDVESIHSYLLATPSKAPAAETIKTQALKFYESAGFWDKNLSTDWFDQFRTKRNQFNLANAVTAADKAAVTKTLESGLTTEQMKGQSRPKVDTKTGAVGSAAKALPLSSEGQPVLTRVLKKNMNGEDVKAWQTFLGLTPATGYFDTLTDSKTKAFQSSKHLTVDGAVGKLSWNAAFPIVPHSDLAPSNANTATIFAPNVAAPAFSPAPKAGKSVASNSPFAPTPGAPKTAPNPAAGPASPVIGTPPVSPLTAAASMVTAGFDPSKWSTGAKVIGGLAAVALAGGAVMTHKEKAGNARR